MTVAQAYGLPGFVRMPPEITQIIRDHSQSSLFWRLTAALDLAARFDDTPMSRLSSIPVRQVAEWERGCAPVQSHALTHLPIIRLTVDARGIRKLERLPAGEPRYMSRKSDNAVFIIEDEGRFDGVAALFKVTRPWLVRGRLSQFADPENRMARPGSNFPRRIPVFTPGIHPTPLSCYRRRMTHRLPKPAGMALSVNQLALALSTCPR